MDIHEIRQLHSLPALVVSLAYFARHGYRADLRIYSPAIGELVVPGEMISRRSNAHYVVKQGHFLADADVKYIMLRRDSNPRLMVELTMLDFAQIAEHIDRARASLAGLTLHGKQFHWHGRPLLQTRTQQLFHGKRHPRTVLWTLQPLAEAPLEGLAAAFDCIHGFNCYDAEAVAKLPDAGLQAQLMRALAGSGAREPAMRQELRLSQELQTALVRLLEQEQRPLMIMTQRQVARLVARRAQTADVLRLGGANLALYLRRVAADNPAVELVEP